jgi:AraC-like DNA-binding protein
MAGFRQQSTDAVELPAVPYPAVTVGIDLGDSPLVIEDATGRQLQGSVVAGLAPDGVRVRGRNIECLQVRLSPTIAYSLLGATAELGGSVTALDDLWGRDATRTCERIRAAASWQDRFVVAEDALARRLHARRATDPEVAFAWAQMLTSNGKVRVEDVASEVGWSRKRLWARFGSQIGLTPKRAAQLVRFDHAAHRLAGGERAALVAAESGYADQSHLHREVAAFAGVTPTAVAVAPWLAVDDIAWSLR